MPEGEYVACVQQDGRVYRSRPHPDRDAVERAAAEAGGWVELMIPTPDRARFVPAACSRRPGALGRAT